MEQLHELLRRLHLLRLGVVVRLLADRAHLMLVAEILPHGAAPVPLVPHHAVAPHGGRRCSRLRLLDRGRLLVLRLDLVGLELLLLLPLVVVFLLGGGALLLVPSQPFRSAWAGVARRTSEGRLPRGAMAAVEA